MPGQTHGIIGIVASCQRRRVIHLRGCGFAGLEGRLRIRENEAALAYLLVFSGQGNLSVRRLFHLPVAAEHAEPNELTIAADTIVTFDGKLLGKPANEEEARTMLHELSGRTHQVATGVCIVRAGDVTAPHAAESLSFVDVTDVTFYELTDEQIERYVASGEPMDKAGAYGIQGVGGRMLVHDISGDFYNVVGLPIARVARAIQKLS